EARRAGGCGRFPLVDPVPFPLPHRSAPIVHRLLPHLPAVGLVVIHPLLGVYVIAALVAVGPHFFESRTHGRAGSAAARPPLSQARRRIRSRRRWKTRRRSFFWKDGVTE